MLNSEFEKAVQQKMDELKITPSGEVWEKVASQLPAPNRRRRWIVFFLLFALLTGAGIYKWYVTQLADQGFASQTLPVAPAETKNNQKKNRIPASEDLSRPNTTLAVKSGPVRNVNDAVLTARVLTSQKRQILSSQQSTTSDLSVVSSKPLRDNAAGKTRVHISAPGTEEIKITGEKEVNARPEGVDEKLADSLMPNGKILPQQKLLIAMTEDTGQVKKTDPVIKNKRSPRWEIGLSMGGGVSDIKAGLFDNKKVFADAQGGLNSGSGNPPAQPGLPPATPGPGFTYETGIYFDKQLTPHLRFHTGVNFASRSSRLKTGTRTDSSTSVSFGQRSLQVNSYYRTGNNSTYRNKFYLLELPLAVRYQFSEKFPLFASAGTSLGYLVHSNVLVYDERRAIYATDDDVLNKFLMSAEAGAGIDLSKIKVPLRLGYKMSYTLGSVTKTAYGKQHLLCSTVYAEFRLKK